MPGKSEGVSNLVLCFFNEKRFFNQPLPPSSIRFFNNSAGSYVFAACSPVCFHKDSEIASPVTGKVLMFCLFFFANLC
jgi:hypothetical protein